MAFLHGTLRQSLRPPFNRLPSPVRGWLRAGLERLPLVGRLISATDRDRPAGGVRWGDLRRATPFSHDWGYDRGTPIDRFYIDKFLACHNADVRGACLEVQEADYTERFGGGRVSRRDVLDINPVNPAATVIADLCEPDSLPKERFDCIIFTQTLDIVADMQTAMANVWRALAPGGVLLLTAPALSPHDARKGFQEHRWRVIAPGLEWLLARLPGAEARIVTYGNLLSCVAFLYGLAAEELTPEELDLATPAFPLIITARVRKESRR